MAQHRQPLQANGTAAGRRRTLQRQAIRAVFGVETRPLGIAEILAAAQAAVPSLNQATVYRNLNRLVADGWLLKISHPEAGTLFERAGKEHHHHFYCRGCRNVLELPGCPLRPGIPAPPGFVTENHEVYLYGLCQDCSIGPATAAKTVRRQKK